MRQAVYGCENSDPARRGPLWGTLGWCRDKGVRRGPPEQLAVRGATHETAWWSCSALPRRALARARFATTRLAMSVAGFDNGASGRRPG